MTMNLFTRRAVLLAATALTLAACGNAESDTSANNTSGDALREMSLGSPDAPVTLVEYASITCPHCKTFHEEIMPTLKATYIAEGQLRYVFNDFPTPPQNIAVAGAAIGRCVGEDKYFDVLDDLFENQTGIMSAARAGAAKAALEAVAGRHGLSPEEFETCINNPDIRKEIVDIVMQGEDLGVRSTPTLFLNGERLTTAYSHTLQGLSELIDAELGIEPPVEPDAAEEPAEDDTAPELIEGE
ncbi:MAG: thioredoxin domain-containing protein [Hyphomonadaceae bacterium]